MPWESCGLIGKTAPIATCKLCGFMNLNMTLVWKIVKSSNKPFGGL